MSWNRRKVTPPARRRTWLVLEKLLESEEDDPEASELEDPSLPGAAGEREEGRAEEVEEVEEASEELRASAGLCRHQRGRRRFFRWRRCACCSHVAGGARCSVLSADWTLLAEWR